MSAADRTVEHVTCLGCGCACDDITVVVQRGRLTDAKQACALGVAWFGDGRVPDEIRINGREGTLERALAEAAKILTGAKHSLVYLAGDISCEAQRDAVGIADRLKGAIDSLAGSGAAGLLAAQRRESTARGTVERLRERDQGFGAVRVRGGRARLRIGHHRHVSCLGHVLDEADRRPKPRILPHRPPLDQRAHRAERIELGVRRDGHPPVRVRRATGFAHVHGDHAAAPAPYGGGQTQRIHCVA